MRNRRIIGLASFKGAVFLDRDGVLCEDTDYVTSFEKLHIYDFAKEAVEYIHRAGYLAIVVTNQSGVARGMMTEEMVQALNAHLKSVTGVDDIYYCPHLPPAEGTEEQPPYRVFCNCRKPAIGMILNASEKHHSDLAKSYMVGDRQTDMQTGRTAGVKTVCITDGKMINKNQMAADIYYNNVLEFAKALQEGHCE